MTLIPHRRELFILLGIFKCNDIALCFKIQSLPPLRDS